MSAIPSPPPKQVCRRAILEDRSTGSLYGADVCRDDAGEEQIQNVKPIQRHRRSEAVVPAVGVIGGVVGLLGGPVGAVIGGAFGLVLGALIHAQASRSRG